MRASGAKLGATLGVFTLPLIKADFGVPVILTLMAGVSLPGLLLTRLLRVDAGNRTLEQHHEADLP